MQFVMCFDIYVLILSHLCGIMGLKNSTSGNWKTIGNSLLINASSTITNIMKSYDNRLRPKFGSGALNIDLELVVASFDSISEVNMDYTITVYLNQYWHDERLAYNIHHPQLMMTMPGDFTNEIWVPDTFLANDKYSFLHDVTEKNRMLRIYGNGDVFYGMRFTTTLACMMDLHYYPLDEQNCTVEIESYGYPLDDVQMNWRNGRNAVHNLENVHMIQFTLRDYDISTLVSNLSTGLYQRLSLSFKLQRNIGFFVFQTYLPSILIVMLSWVSFWISHEATSARVALGITTVLTMTTISTGVRSSLPRISYVKAIDVYLVVCFAFVFSALLEYAAVNYTFWGERARQKKRKLKEEFERSQTNSSKASISRTLSEDCSKRYQFDSVESPKNPSSNSYTCRRKCYHDTNLFDQMPKSLQTASSSTVYLRNRKYKSGYRHYIGKLKSQLRLGKEECPENIPMSSSSNYNDYSHPKGPLTSQCSHNMVFSSSKPMKLKTPKPRDVNVIDKYSRILFPSFFIMFNIGYFCIYSLL